MLESGDLAFGFQSSCLLTCHYNLNREKHVLVELFLGIDAHSCLHHSVVVARQQNPMSAFFIRAYRSELLKTTQFYKMKHFHLSVILSHILVFLPEYKSKRKLHALSKVNST